MWTLMEKTAAVRAGEEKPPKAMMPQKTAAPSRPKDPEGDRA
jgi:hypothetical protein